MARNQFDNPAELSAPAKVVSDQFRKHVLTSVKSVQVAFILKFLSELSSPQGELNSLVDMHTLFRQT